MTIFSAPDSKAGTCFPVFINQCFNQFSTDIKYLQTQVSFRRQVEFYFCAWVKGGGGIFCRKSFLGVVNMCPAVPVGFAALGLKLAIDLGAASPWAYQVNSVPIGFGKGGISSVKDAVMASGNLRVFCFGIGSCIDHLA